MQTNGGIGAYASEGLGNHSVMDGVDDCGTGATNGVSNGECMAAAEVKTTLTKSQQEVIRLIGQFLRNLGLTRTVEQLANESGCILEDPNASQLRQHVMEGEWEKVDVDILQLQLILSISSENLTKMRLMILEQKYLEMLEDGETHEALDCLRKHMTPLKPNDEHVRQLTSYLMCSSSEDIRRLAKWSGKGAVSRGKLLESIQAFLPSSLMVPPQRLMTLLGQAAQRQIEQCKYHNTCYTESPLELMSLLSDHVCSKEQFPCVTAQILTDHIDDVWFCRFSPDGTKFASGAKDGSLIIYDVDKETFTMKKRVTLVGQNSGIAHISWSPNSAYILTCGPDGSSEVLIWNVETGQQKTKVMQSNEDSLTTAAWFKDNNQFVAGGTKGHFYECNLDGNVVATWEGIRVQGLVCLSDNRTVLAADSHNRIRAYNFDDHSDSEILQEHHAIMSFTVNESEQLALLNIKTQGVNLWDLPSKSLVRKFIGVTQSFYTIHSCFGGLNQNFVASGSEDCQVYIWHIKREKAIATLEGHTRTVNCVHWNPAVPGMLASASDDDSVRIWAPESALSNRNIEGLLDSEDQTHL